MTDNAQNDMPDDIRPCPFCDCRLTWRRSMQVVHPENDCILSGLMFTDSDCTHDNIDGHKWNLRAPVSAGGEFPDDPLKLEFAAGHLAGRKEERAYQERLRMEQPPAPVVDLEKAVKILDRMIEAVHEEVHPNDWRTEYDGTPFGDLKGLRQPLAASGHIGTGKV